MIQSHKRFSYKTRAKKMQNHRIRIQKRNASIRDLLYIMVSIFILGSFFQHFEFRIIPKGAELVTKVQAQVITPQPTPIVKEVIKTVQVEKTDNRATKLKSFLEEKGSPLAPYSSLIVSEADKYALDWTKLVAIAGIESCFAKCLPSGSYNAWGFGGHHFMYFKSWEESIEFGSKLLGTHYKQAENQGVKYNYCPASDGCNPAWATIVTNNTNDILAMEDNK